MILGPTTPSQRLLIKGLGVKKFPPPARPEPDNLKPKRWKHGQLMRTALPVQQGQTMSVLSGAINQKTRR